MITIVLSTSGGLTQPGLHTHSMDINDHNSAEHLWRHQFVDDQLLEPYCQHKGRMVNRPTPMNPTTVRPL